MKKLIFLLIPLLLTSLVSSCAFVEHVASSLMESDVEQEPEVQEYQRRQETLRQIKNAKERAEQKLTPQKRMEYARARQVELSKYAESIQIEQEKAQQERELYDREQEAKYKRFNEEWVEFIQNGEGSVKNKTTQEVKKLVDQWKNRRWMERMEKMDFSSDNFYKIFGKPWKTQYLEDKYYLWYTCKGGYVQIAVSAYSFDNGWIDILDLNIL